jgi:hypothetical protein
MPKKLHINGHRADIDAIFEYWKRVMDRSRSHLDDTREQAIARVLAIGYTVEEVKTAIEGCKSSAFHMGLNDRGTCYNDIELICRDAKHLDTFMERAKLERRKHDRTAPAGSTDEPPPLEREESITRLHAAMASFKKH